MKVFNKIINQLKENNIQYELSEHEEVRTSADAAAVRGVDLSAGAKSMVVKANDKFYLFVLPANKQINWKAVKKLLNVKNIRLATSEEAESITNVQMGCVPPFGNILELETFYDLSLLENKIIYFNPGLRTHTIAMGSKDLILLVSPFIEEFAI